MIMGLQRVFLVNTTDYAATRDSVRRHNASRPCLGRDDDNENREQPNISFRYPNMKESPPQCSSLQKPSYRFVSCRLALG